jgi:hypothetical protein
VRVGACSRLINGYYSHQEAIVAESPERIALETDRSSTSRRADSTTDAVPGLTPAGAAVLQQAAHIVRPLVRLLLEHGVTFPQLADTLKGVFIEAAQRNMAHRPGRMTDSEVAVRTGIHRKDVKRLRSEIAADEPRAADDGPRSLTSAVFTRWLSDPTYCDKVGEPKALARAGDSPQSFETLVRSISKDVHPRTVLNELERLNLVLVENDSVQLKVNAFVPNADFAQMLRYMGENLHDHAAAAVRNMLGTAPKFLEQSVYSDAIRVEGVDELAGLARREWTQLLKTVVPEVARYEPNEQENAGGGETPAQCARVRLGMYFYAEDVNPPPEHPQQQPHGARRTT